MFCPLWPKLFADLKRETRTESQETGQKLVKPNPPQSYINFPSGGIGTAKAQYLCLS
jgi:hypothetical protein